MCTSQRLMSLLMPDISLGDRVLRIADTQGSPTADELRRVCAAGSQDACAAGPRGGSPRRRRLRGPWAASCRRSRTDSDSMGGADALGAAAGTPGVRLSCWPWSRPTTATRSCSSPSTEPHTGQRTRRRRGQYRSGSAATNSSPCLSGGPGPNSRDPPRTLPCHWRKSGPRGSACGSTAGKAGSFQRPSLPDSSPCVRLTTRP